VTTNGRPGKSGTVAPQTLIGDENYFGHAFERELVNMGAELLRPAPKGEMGTARSTCVQARFKPLLQVIESIKKTFKGQLDLERHRARTPVASSPASCSASPG
jgi:hypothetical protein